MIIKSVKEYDSDIKNLERELIEKVGETKAFNIVKELEEDMKYLMEKEIGKKPFSYLFFKTLIWILIPISWLLMIAFFFFIGLGIYHLVIGNYEWYSFALSAIIYIFWLIVTKIHAGVVSMIAAIIRPNKTDANKILSSIFKKYNIEDDNIDNA